MLDPVAHAITNAPVEDEELTPETAEALDRARASLARGEGISHEEILREFGAKNDRAACADTGHLGAGSAH